MLQQISVIRRKTVGTEVPVQLNSPEVSSLSVLEMLNARPAFLPHETDDTRLTGGTRSLNRRLLALNVEGTLVRRHAGPQSAILSLHSLGRSA